ncbi:MAG: L-threonylcarbamoyladenylate synthase [Balneolaceae bacterium]|nr:L-threonylcarbamoyladenylate synthase [Balneolaceae bacterium]
MAERIKLHPVTPHVKRIFEIADRIRQGAVILFPTDSQYALGCEYKNKKGIERIREIRDLDEGDHLTILCDSLSGISKFAHISDRNFKLIKRLIPGPYTFILPATKQVPKLLVHPKKKTVGIRVPDYPICELLGREVGHPLVSITAKKPDLGEEMLETYEREPFLREFEKSVDLIIDNQQELPHRETTIIDMTGEYARIIRSDLGADRAEEVFRAQGEPLEEAAAI